MKSSKIQIVALIISSLLVTLSTFAAPSKSSIIHSPNTAVTVDLTKTLDANALLMFVTNVGNFANDKTSSLGRASGLYYPRGTTKTVMYNAGIWVGAKVNNQIRIAAAEYSSEYAPGPMQNGTFLPDNADFRVFKMKKGDTNSNPDYAEWPITMGAPVDNQGKPLVLGDQTTWAVYNDADTSKHKNGAGHTAELGIEIQQTSFAYSSLGTLSSVIFMKFKVINKGLNQLDSTYVSIWADPDLGDANDDLVGCDTLKSLGFCYNPGPDAVYGSVPPAVGVDFLQGPMIPGAPADSAFMAGKWRKGFKNLPLTSFNKYTNGTDPDNFLVTYTYMKGLNRDGSSVINPDNSKVTKFYYSGDPVVYSGWIDPVPADKRMMLDSGPFSMAPGDTQEVICAVIVGKGSDPLQSVNELKLIDINAKALYRSNFDGNYPTSDLNPSLYLRSSKSSIDLTWGSEPVNYIQYFSGLDQLMEFEGLNLYQGESPTGPWHKIATYDLDDSVALIYQDVFDPISGGIERVIVQSGTNSGLRNHQVLNTSFIGGTPFVSGQTYYFAATAYFYDHNHLIPFNDLSGNLLGYLTPNFETNIVPHAITAISSPGLTSDTAQHISGVSDGLVAIEYLDLSKVTGHDYEVSFNSDGLWNLRDATTDIFKLILVDHHTDDYEYPVVDGIMVRPIGPDPGIKNWLWSGGSRWLTGYDFGGLFFFGGLFAGPDFFGSNIDPRHDYVDVEIRFSKFNTQKAYDYLRGGTPNYGYIGYFNCPFTVWDVTTYPARQLNALFVENKSGPTFDSTWFPGADGAASREYLMILKSSYSPTPLSFYTSKLLNTDASDMDILYALTSEIRAGHDPNVEFQEGQIFTILASKPNSPADLFRFHAGPRCGDVDISGVVNLSDVVYLINYIFAGGAAPVFTNSADGNCDQKINLTDAVYLINFIFAGGPSPCASCQR